MRLLPLFLVGLAAVGAGTRMSREQALAQVFGKQAKPASTAFWWNAEQRAEVARLAGVASDAVAARQTAWHLGDSGADGTTAWFDARKVRTKKQLVMVSVRADGTVGEVLVTAFGEPNEYLASDRWLEQFEGRALDDELALKKSIHGITGATLTAQATVAAVREVLAARAVAYPPPPEPVPTPEEEPAPVPEPEEEPAADPGPR